MNFLQRYNPLQIAVTVSQQKQGRLLSGNKHAYDKTLFREVRVVGFRRETDDLNVLEQRHSNMILFGHKYQLTWNPSPSVYYSMVVLVLPDRTLLGFISLMFCAVSF